MSSSSCNSRAANRIGFDSIARANLHGYSETQGFYGPKSGRTAPIVIILVAATMLGASSGVLIADRDALPLLKDSFASQLAGVRGYLFPGADSRLADPESPTVIPTGLSSISAIHYSSKPGSARMAFDLLRAADLVRTGKLRRPDRIYFDLQDRGREQGTLRQLKAQKAVSLEGNLLTGVRISQRKQGATRIVLDLRRSCDFTYQTSPGPPSRLMVEIRPLSSGIPASE